MPGVRICGEDVGQAYYIRNQYAKRDLFAQSFNHGCLAVRGSIAVAFGKLSNITFRGALSWWLYVSAMRLQHRKQLVARSEPSNDPMYAKAADMHGHDATFAPEVVERTT